MKIVYCTCNVSVLDALLKQVDDLGVENYQVMEQVIARNARGDNRLNTPVWPGFNSTVIMQIADDAKVAELMSAIREFNKLAFNDNELVIAASWTVDDYCNS